MMLRFLRGRRLFLAVFVLLLPLLFRPGIFGFDPVGYYSWVRSAVLDGNLDTTDEYQGFGIAESAGPTVTGHNHNPFAIGASLLWLPFFLLAHFLASVWAALTGSNSPTGYEAVYVILVSCGSVLYGFAAVLIVFEIAKRSFGESVAKIATLGGWLATPLVFYMYSHPTMAHAADAFANAVVVAAWVALKRSTPMRWLFLGAATGLAMLIRTQNALLIAIPVLELAYRLWQGIRAHRGSRRAHQPVSGGSVRAWGMSFFAYALGGMLVFWPQILTWRIVYGRWIVWNPYAYSDGGHFIWGQLSVNRVLFSTDRGLFVWSPIVLLGVLGLVRLYHRDRRLAVFLGWSLASQVVLVSLWSFPSGAVAFGARLLLNNLPTYVLGLACFVEWMRRRGLSIRALAMGAAGFVLWNFLLIAQYATQTIPRAGTFPIADLIVGQFTVLPSHSDRILQALLTRQ